MHAARALDLRSTARPYTTTGPTRDSDGPLEGSPRPRPALRCWHHPFLPLWLEEVYAAIRRRGSHPRGESPRAFPRSPQLLTAVHAPTQVEIAPHLAGRQIAR